MSNSKQRSSMSQQQRDHHANQLNTNTGTQGTNKANGKVHGNRVGQLNPNRK